ncbi:metal-dependent hydrolase [Legionella tunisiensis]|uniref:metal-dependent hydrolase n=1 Tax=Legionella tunisiensis TaxID=1034944 RepID=UPI0002E55A2C
MDPITQGALGASCAQLLLHKCDKRNAWLVGALAGMAADLDILIYSPQDPMLSALYHRHFTHSLSFIPLGGLLVAAFLALLNVFVIAGG